MVDACCAVIDNPEITIDELIKHHIQGPDFPTGGIILGRSGIAQAFHTGRGSVPIRGRATVEEFGKNREAIIITEVPYQVNKSRMIEIIAEAVRDKKLTEFRIFVMSLTGMASVSSSKLKGIPWPM